MTASEQFRTPRSGYPSFGSTYGPADAQIPTAEHRQKEMLGTNDRLQPCLSHGLELLQQRTLYPRDGRKMGTWPMIYIRTGEAWLYLTAVLDLADRRWWLDSERNHGRGSNHSGDLESGNQQQSGVIRFSFPLRPS